MSRVRRLRIESESNLDSITLVSFATYVAKRIQRIPG